MPAELTKEEILRNLPRYERGGRLSVRPAFREFERILKSYDYKPHELRIIADWVDSMKKVNGIRPPKGAPVITHFQSSKSLGTT